ncbi:MAG: HD domain-containing protein, partial [Acidimicrobiia bacterium]
MQLRSLQVRLASPVRLASTGAWVTALALVVAWRMGFLGDPSFDLGRLVLAAAIVTLGELLEVDLKGGRSTPVSNALVFALFVILDAPASVLTAVLPAFAVAMAVRGAQIGWGPRFRSTSRRLGNTILALGAFVALTRVIPAFPVPKGELLSEVISMVFAGLVYLVADTASSAGFIARNQGVPFRPVWFSQLQNLAALHVAFLSVAALMGVAFQVLSDWALILFLLPLFATQYSFRRYASIHKTYTQTIRALSTLPELAGYAPEGHSVRVAETAMAVARQHGMSESAVQEVEFAALLHDVGYLSFEDPHPSGSNGSKPPTEEEIARASAALVEQTPYLERVAKLVRDQD